MKPFVLDCAYSSVVLDRVKSLIDDGIVLTNYTSVRIEGNKSNIKYDFTFIGDEYVRPIAITSGLACGYGGEGPRTAIECMKMFGFEISEEFEALFCSEEFVENGDFEVVIRKQKDGIIVHREEPEKVGEPSEANLRISKFWTAYPYCKVYSSIEELPHKDLFHSVQLKQVQYWDKAALRLKFFGDIGTDDAIVEIANLSVDTVSKDVLDEVVASLRKLGYKCCVDLKYIIVQESSEKRSVFLTKRNFSFDWIINDPSTNYYSRLL